MQVTSGAGAGSGYGQRYIVNMGNMVRGIRQRALHHFIQEKYDVPTARICKVAQNTCNITPSCDILFMRDRSAEHSDIAMLLVFVSSRVLHINTPC